MKKLRLEIVILLAIVLLCTAEAWVQAQSPSENAPPSVLKEDQSAPNYVYDLKLLIRKSRENIKSVDEKIKEQAVIKRNQKREEKAREYYLQAQKLSEDGRLDEARELYEKAIRITEHPEMKYYIKVSEARARAQEAALTREEEDKERRLREDEQAVAERAETAYQAAVSLYRQQEFKEARTAFEAVEEILPDYKATRSYLEIISQDLVRVDGVLVREQKSEIERQQKELEVARLREKELWRKEIERKEEARRQQLKSQAEAVYNDAVRLYRERNFLEARQKFQEVEWVVSDYKATRAYLNRIEQDIELDKKAIQTSRQKELEKQRWEETVAERRMEQDKQKALLQKEKEHLASVKDQAEFLFVAATALFDQGKLEEARDKFNEIEGLNPDYRSTRDFLARIDAQFAEAASKEESARKAEAEKRIWQEEAERKRVEREEFQRRTEEADEFYRQGMDLYRMGRLIEAKEKLLLVDERVPDYQATRESLKKIDRDIELLVRTKKHESTLAEQKAELDRLKQRREEAERIYVEALRLYESAQYEQAKPKFVEVAGIFSDYKRTAYYLARIDDDIVRRKEAEEQRSLQARAEAVYAGALADYGAGRYEEAKKKFVETAVLVPDYKQTVQYLDRIDDDIIRKREEEFARLREIQVIAPYEEAVELYRKQDYVQAKQKFLEVTAVLPDFRDTAKYLEGIDEDIFNQKKEIEQREVQARAADLYGQAMAAYRAEDFQAAKEFLVRIEVLLPDYRDVFRYLERIDQDIAAKVQKEESARLVAEASPLYVQAQQAYRAEDFETARNLFVRVNDLVPAYRDVQKYLLRLDQDIKSREARLARAERLRQVEAMYSQALAAHARRDFEQAKPLFQKLEAFEPGYRNTRQYLVRMDRDIRQEIETRDRQKLENDVSKAYAEAVAFYHNQEFRSARLRFEDVARLLPDYKKTRYYLSRIAGDQKQMEKRDERLRLDRAERDYLSANAFLGQKKYAEALERLAAIEGYYPGYKSVRSSISLIEKEMALKPQKSEAPAVVRPSVVEAPVVVRPPEVKQAEPALTEDQLMAVYRDGVNLFKARQYREARVFFEKVTSRQPSYRSTARYLQIIDSELAASSVVLNREAGPSKEKISVKAKPVVAKKRQVEAKQKPAAVKKPQVETKEKPVVVMKHQVEAKEKPAAAKKNSAASKKKPAVVRKNPVVSAEKPLVRQSTAGIQANSPVAQAEPLYLQAVALYKKRDYTAAGEKFRQVQGILPGYKSSAKYLDFISQVEAGQTPELPQAADADKDAQAVRELALRSQVLYSQIRSLSQDQEIASAARTFSRIDRIIASIESEQKRLAAGMLREEARYVRKANQDRELERIRDAKSREKAADQLSAAAKKAAENSVQKKNAVKSPASDVKSSRLDKRIEDSYCQATEAIKARKYDLAGEILTRLEVESPGYKDVPRLLNLVDREKDFARLMEQENADRLTIAALAEKANSVNLEILELSRVYNYEGIREKFNDLEGVLLEIRKIKQTMLTRRSDFTARWEDRRKVIQKARPVAVKTMDQAVAEHDGQTNKGRARQLLKEGQQFMRAGHYPEARAKFLESYQLDSTLAAARTYLNKVDRLISGRDFELQQQRNRQELRGIERAQESAEASEGQAGTKTADLVMRNRLLLQDASRLYRQKHWREARVKFEELEKTGDERQKATAFRYLELIRKDLENERQKQEVDRVGRQEEYLESRRDQARLLWRKEKDGRQVSADRDTDIKRQKELRLLEKQNLEERQQMLNLLRRENRKQVQADSREKSRFSRRVSGEAVTGQASGSGAAVDGMFAEQKTPEVPSAAGSQNVTIPAPPAVKVPVKASVPERPQDSFMPPRVVPQAPSISMVSRLSAAERREAARRRKMLERYQSRAVVARSRSVEKIPSVPVAATHPQVPVQPEKTVQPDFAQAVAEPFKDSQLAAALEEKKRIERAREAARKEFEAGVERLYVEAIVLYRKKMYEASRTAFLQVDEMIRKYKSTDDYLTRIAGHLKTAPSDSSSFEKTENVSTTRVSLKPQTQDYPARPVRAAVSQPSSRRGMPVLEQRIQAVSDALDAMESRL